MLRFLAVAGIQPSIDIRTKTMFQVGSERLVSGVNLIADMAGCRWPEADQRYLANLNRLGLVRFSSEPVADYRRYALLEVQPRALEVTENVPKTISVYRSIYLSEFGQQFCEVCIDTDGYNAQNFMSGDAYKACTDAVDKCAPKQQLDAAEIADSVARVAQELGKPVRHFSYPYGDEGSAGEREFEIARDLGIETAVTTRKGLIRAAHADAMTALPRLGISRVSESARPP